MLTGRLSRFARVGASERTPREIPRRVLLHCAFRTERATLGRAGIVIPTNPGCPHPQATPKSSPAVSEPRRSDVSRLGESGEAGSPAPGGWHEHAPLPRAGSHRAHLHARVGRTAPARRLRHTDHGSRPRRRTRARVCDRNDRGEHAVGTRRQRSEVVTMNLRNRACISVLKDIS